MNEIVCNGEAKEEIQNSNEYFSDDHDIPTVVSTQHLQLEEESPIVTTNEEVDRSDDEIVVDIENPSKAEKQIVTFDKKESHYFACFTIPFACTWALVIQCCGWLRRRARRLYRKTRKRKRPRQDLNGPLCIIAWCIGSRLSHKQEEDLIQAKKRCRRLKRHLTIPNPCDIPEYNLHYLVQARLVLIMWIHLIGFLLIGGIGGGAYANDLTWRPELGAAIGPPLSLATLAVCKGVTCLLVVASLFQRVRIPPCLATLGCAPKPLKPKVGQRPLPFRKLSSQMLKRFICAKLIDSAFGFTLMAALKSAIVRSRGRRGHLLKFILAIIAIGLTFVDFYGLPVSIGTVAHYIHFLWYRPDGTHNSDDWESTSSEDNDDSDDQNVVSPFSNLLASDQYDDYQQPGPTMRFADPDYAREQQNQYLAENQHEPQELVSTDKKDFTLNYNPLLASDAAAQRSITKSKDEFNINTYYPAARHSSLIEIPPSPSETALSHYYAEERRYLDKLITNRQEEQQEQKPSSATG
uniref:Uncharacterized protein n=1 Tax=Aureoumbra lagunensis TaxID=44058 RepID=A0A7S3NMY5_9STRA